MNPKRKCTLRKRYSRLYQIWANIKTRCYDKNSKAYQDYGRRGIGMCYEWQESFETFFIWAMENGYTDELNYRQNRCKWRL